MDHSPKASPISYVGMSLTILVLFSGTFFPSISYLPKYLTPDFHFSLLVLLTSCILLYAVKLIRKKELKIVFSHLDLGVSVLATYILIRFFFTEYASISQGDFNWFLSLALAYAFLRQLSCHPNFSGSFLVAILLLASIQIIWGQLQLLGLLPSRHPLFSITGSFFNPALYAGFLAIVFPLALGNILKDRPIESSSLDRILRLLSMGVGIGTLLVIIPTQSRAAWLSLLAGVLFIIVSRYNLISYIKKASLTIKSLATVTVLVSILSTIYSLYRIRPDSANGRLLIWKVSKSMWEEALVFGKGFGRWAADYNVYQGQYLGSGAATNTEKYVADSVSISYNEFIQLAVDFGIVGVLLFVTVLTIALFTKKNTGNISYKASLIAWIVFASFSYPFNDWGLSILLLVILAVLSSGTPLVANLLKQLHLIPLLLIIPLAIWLSKSHRGVKMWEVAKSHYMNQEYNEANENYRLAISHLPCEGRLIQEYAKCLQENGAYEESLKQLTTSKRYYNDIYTYISLGENYAETNLELAQSSFITAANMIPTRIYSKYLLFEMLLNKGKKEEAKKVAAEILETKIKSTSTAYEVIIDRVKAQLKKMKD